MIKGDVGRAVELKTSLSSGQFNNDFVSEGEIIVSDSGGPSSVSSGVNPSGSTQTYLYRSYGLFCAFEGFR